MRDELTLTPPPATARHERLDFRVRRRRAVAAGLHPTGFRLGPEGRTCAECGHCYRRRFNHVFTKCELVGDTAGPATDISSRWPACERFKETER